MASNLLPSDSPEGEQVLQDYYKSTTPRAYFHSAMPLLADYVDPPPLSHYQATTPIEQQGEKIPPTEPGTLPGALLDVVQATGLPELKGAALAAKPLAAMFVPAARASAELAERLTAQGITKEAIWNRLGVFQGADGKWRREIPDIGSQLTAQPGGVEQQLGGKLVHPALYDEMPDLQNIEMWESNKLQPGAGSYRKAGTTRPETIETSLDPNRETVLHEVMHAIQQRGGFARGGSPSSIKPIVKEALQAAGIKNPSRDDIDKYAYESYQRLAGEVEARNVEFRSVFPPEWLKKNPPWTTEDRPRDKQTVIGLTKVEHDPFTGPQEAVPWSSEDVEKLKTGYKIGKPVEQILADLGSHTRASVYHKARDLGIISNAPRGRKPAIGDPEEDAKITDMLNQGATYREIGDVIGKSKHAVQRATGRLGYGPRPTGRKAQVKSDDPLLDKLRQNYTLTPVDHDPFK